MTFQSKVSVLPSRNIQSKSDMLKFSIEEHLQDQYPLTNTNLKWPYIGDEFESVRWKPGIVHDADNVKTTLQVS